MPGNITSRLTIKKNGASTVRVCLPEKVLSAAYLFKKSRNFDRRHLGLLRNRKPASDHKFIERFLSITRGLPNIKESQFITNILFVGLVDLFRGGHWSLRRVCIHADQLMGENFDRQTIERGPGADKSADSGMFVGRGV
ncbi:hypothetical protein ACYZUC_10440 [Pseudomonas sp. GT1P32]